MSAFDARSATEVNIPQWSPVWVSEDFSKSMIVRLNALYSPTRQNETLEGREDRRAGSKLTRDGLVRLKELGHKCVKMPNVVVETSWKVEVKTDGLDRLKELGQK